MKNIILIIVSALFLSSCYSDGEIKQEETNQNRILNSLNKSELTALLANKDFSGVQFIDVRTPHQFALGHLPNAINIPATNFFDKKRFKAIPEGKKLLVYGEDASAPKMMSILASHFNKGDFYTIGGSYNYIDTTIINGLKINLNLYDDEVPIVDFQKEIDRIRAEAGTVVSPKKKVRKSKPFVKRKKKAISGGCS